jgi:AraC-like DNA-binding protein
MDSLVVSLALPEVYGAGRYHLGDRNHAVAYNQGRSHALHLHDYRGSWRCAGTDHQLEPGTITISPNRVVNTYDLPVPGRHWCVHFSVEPVVGPGLTLPILVHAGSDAAYARERLARIATLVDRARGGGRAEAVGAGAALLELLVWYAGLGARTLHSDRGGVATERAAALVREHPERTWTTAGLARRAGVSAAWLAAGFRTRFAMTVARYVLVQRIERARVLLATSTLPVAEIGHLVGLPDPQHFNKRFRSVVGQAPSACRGRLDRTA